MSLDDTQSKSHSLPRSLDQVRIERLPPAAYYIADFITEDEERHILEKVPCIFSRIGLNNMA